MISFESLLLYVAQPQSKGLKLQTFVTYSPLISGLLYKACLYVYTYDQPKLMELLNNKLLKGIDFPPFTHKQ